MSYTYKKKNGKKGVDKKKAFVHFADINDVTSSHNVRKLLDRFDSSIRQKHSGISQNALNNCHGDWYEWFIAINAWNYSQKNKKNLLLWLPKKTSLKITNLYEKELQNLIEDLEKKVKKSTSVNLVTSNPDFVILNRNTINVPGNIKTPISDISKSNLDTLEEAYKSYLGQCSFEDIVGYLSVKTSFRPDRRIQIAHEGSLMKAIYTHLQTRNWVINPKGLKYYAGAIEIKKADLKSMKTVATQSITTVHSTPIPAVDEVFTLDTTQKVIGMLDKIL